MASMDGPLHRCPACGSGACWTAPLQPDEAHEARALLYCADCGALLGEEHVWYDLGEGDEAAAAPPTLAAPVPPRPALPRASSPTYPPH